MTFVEQVLETIETYCDAVGIAESTFGLRAVNDGKFVGRMRATGRCSLNKADDVNLYIADNPPPPSQEGEAKAPPCASTECAA